MQVTKLLEYSNNDYKNFKEKKKCHYLFQSNYEKNRKLLFYFNYRQNLFCEINKKRNESKSKKIIYDYLI